MAEVQLEYLRFHLHSGYSQGMRSAFLAEQLRYYSMYVPDISYHQHLLHGFSVVLPEHHQDLNSFLLRNISSDAETMPQHQQI